MPLGICCKRGCSKPLSDSRRHAQCTACLQRFHLKCSLPSADIINNNEYLCSSCRDFIFPFNNIETIDLLELFNENVFVNSIMLNKCKCASCKKNIKINNPAAHCSYCSNYFHLNCEKLSKSDFPLSSTWCCSICIMKNLPFSQIGDDNLSMTLHGMNDESVSILTEGAPSFSLKSLLDDMPGQKFDTDQFINNTILSK